MSARLTAKQIEFLECCDQTYPDGWEKTNAGLKKKFVQVPFHFGPLEWDEWGFYNRSSAIQFVDRLVARNLVRSDRQFFYWITDEGRAEIAKATNQQGNNHD